MWVNIFLILEWGNLFKYIMKISNHKRLKILNALQSIKQKKS